MEDASDDALQAMCSVSQTHSFEAAEENYGSRDCLRTEKQIHADSLRLVDETSDYTQNPCRGDLE